MRLPVSAVLGLIGLSALVPGIAWSDFCEDLATLGREGFLPTEATTRVVARYFYQTDGVIYTRLER